jgi:hypothetical protein
VTILRQAEDFRLDTENNDRIRQDRKPGLFGLGPSFLFAAPINMTQLC